MRKYFLIFLSCLVGVFLSVTLHTEVFAKKGVKKANSNPASKETLTVVNNKGERVLNGSVLNPNEDELFIALHSVLVSTLRGDLNNVSVVLSSIADPSMSFTVPKSALRIQNKTIRKKNKKYLSVNLYNVKTPSGITILPSALQKDDYKLRIINNKNKLDVSTESFNYQTPVLIVGMAPQKNSGFVVVEDLLGSQISDSVVSLDANGSFFTEVRANMIKPTTANKGSLIARLKSQTAEEEDDDDIYAGIVHVASDKDLYAISLLDNNPDANNAQADAPLIVNESTTLTANLAKEDEKLALEVAKKQSEGSVDFGDLDCDINQFADRCGNTDKAEIASLGQDVKNLIVNPQCDLPDFVTNFLKNSEDSSVALGYCEFVSRIEDSSKLCTNYSKVLNDFKAGKLKQLPCPPSSCISFQNITPPKCVVTQSFCEDESENTGCISKPKRDLFCLQVPAEVSESQCTDEGNSDSADDPGWVVAINSFENEYCVPSNPRVFSEIQIFSKAVSSPEDIAEECEYNFCHRQCDKKSGTGVKDCHFNCDVAFGRFIDCNIASPYFSNQCCKSLKIRPRAIASKPAYQLASGGSVKPSGLLISTGPIAPDIAGCLCADSNNFNEIGYASDNSKATCRNICPSNYEKDEKSRNCFPICSGGLVRDSNGFCKKECPRGQKKDPNNGQCIPELKCGDNNMLPNPNNNGEAQCICPSALPYWNINQCVASCPHGPPSPNASSNLPLKSPIPCSDGGGQKYCGTVDIPAKDNCSCASGGTPTGPNGTCQCTNGQPYTTAGCGTQNCLAPYVTNPSGIPPCKCPDDKPISFSANCVAKCPEGLIADYPIGGSALYPTTIAKTCLCPDKSYPDQDGKCYSGTSYCSPGITVGTNGCTCNPGGGAYSLSGGYCACLSGQTYTAASGCSGSTSTTNYCSPGIPSTAANPCTCNPGGGAYSLSEYCTCPSGQTYTAASGCSGSTSSSPTTPTALIATSSLMYPNAINLTWTDSSSNETGFSVYRRQSGSGSSSWTLLPSSVPANTPSYIDTSVTAGITYEYYVVACNGTVCSDQSNTAQATASGGSSSTPTAPTTLIATSSLMYPNAINLTWIDSSSNETGFSVYRRTSGSSSWTLLTNSVPANTPSYIDTSVTAGITYEYYVVACNGTVCSDQSNTAQATASGGSSSTPTAPTALIAISSPMFPGVINLMWTDSSSNETGFSVYRRILGSSSWTLLTNSVPANTPSYIDTSVTAGITYEYKVNACNANGCSADSNTATAP